MFHFRYTCFTFVNDAFVNVTLSMLEQWLISSHLLSLIHLSMLLHFFDYLIVNDQLLHFTMIASMNDLQLKFDISSYCQ